MLASRHRGRSAAGLFVAATLAITGCGGAKTSAVQPAKVAGTEGRPMLWTFDTDAVGGLPDGATVFSGAWAVRVEADAPSQPNALCQTGTAEFPALSLGNGVYGDTVLSARVKPISGRTDQAAGLIFRVQDKNNYYILRANALENNVNLYKYVNGRRIDIKQSSAKVAAGRWQELRAEVVGNHLRGLFNGQVVVEATDDTFGSGGVGLWTKADSVTCFDDVEARAP